MKLLVVVVMVLMIQGQRFLLLLHLLLLLFFFVFVYGTICFQMFNIAIKVTSWPSALHGNVELGADGQIY